MFDPKKALGKLLGPRRLTRNGRLDYDGDGLSNFKDCNPFNRYEQGINKWEDATEEFIRKLARTRGEAYARSAVIKAVKKTYVGKKVVRKMDKWDIERAKEKGRPFEGYDPITKKFTGLVEKPLEKHTILIYLLYDKFRKEYIVSADDRSEKGYGNRIDTYARAPYKKFNNQSQAEKYFNGLMKRFDKTTETIRIS